MENIVEILACILTSFRQLRSFRFDGHLEFDSASVKNPYFREMVDTIICKLQERDHDVAAFVQAMRKVHIWQHRGVIVIDISAAEQACQPLLRKTFGPIMESNSSSIYTITSNRLSSRQLEHYLMLLGLDRCEQPRRELMANSNYPVQHQRMASAG